MSNEGLGSESALRSAFKKSPEYSVKWDSYFSIYSDLFQKYVGAEITFIEVGVLHGGSLFMWQEYFGPKARIIGIDLNPEALKWENYGFQIFIGDQADSKFWTSFWEAIGKADVLLGDGGHTNLQQRQTIVCSMASIRDGGMIVIEDTQTSYQKDFGNPSTKSGVSFAKSLVDSIAARNPELGKSEATLTKRISSIRFFESLFVIYVDSSASRLNQIITNQRGMSAAEDFRYQLGSKYEMFLRFSIQKFGFRMASSGKLNLLPNVFLQSIQNSFYLLLKIYLARELK
jgi:hypothetical protein